jgi:hypothetical protein
MRHASFAQNGVQRYEFSASSPQSGIKTASFFMLFNIFSLLSLVDSWKSITFA